MSSGQQIQVPLIGRGNEMVQGLRLQIAAQIAGQLAAVDFSTVLRRAYDKDEAIGGDGSKIEFNVNNCMVGGAAVAYTDGLLLALGLIKQG